MLHASAYLDRFQHHPIRSQLPKHVLEPIRCFPFRTKLSYEFERERTDPLSRDPPAASSFHRDTVVSLI